MSAEPTSTARAGFTIVEMAISTLLLVIGLGAATMAMSRGLGLYEQSFANGAVNARAARTSDRLARELMFVATDSVVQDFTTPPGGPRTWHATMDYCPADDWAAGAAVWGDARQLTLELAAGELDNGVDDDGDGLVDERQIVRIENPGTVDEQRMVVVTGVTELLEGELPNGLDDNGNDMVDEPGFAIELEAGVMTIHTTVGSPGPGGETLLRTQSTSFRLRN